MTVYSAEHLEPARSSWPVECVRLSDNRMQSLRTSARRRLVPFAEDWLSQLASVGRKSGLVSSHERLLTGDPDTVPMIMTGHQPVIFHSGLTYKYETTEEFAARHSLIAIAIVIDADEGDAGAFSIPSIRSTVAAAAQQPRQAGLISAAPTGDCPAPALSPWITGSASFGHGGTLYSDCRMKSPAEIRAESRRIGDNLKLRGFHSEEERFRYFTEHYAGLQTRSMMEANLIVRRNAGIGGRMLEVPLSAICEFPEVLAITEEILSRPLEFAQCYNATLNTYRIEHKIRNHANPFPDLQIDNGNVELPFWIVDRQQGTRSILEVPADRVTALEAITRLQRRPVPRGAMITAILRLLFSDLFIHGTGGGRYDEYTNQFIRAWWHIDPPPFAVASASRYLFESERGELKRLQSISERLRDLQFNPQRYFGKAVFSNTLESALTSLVRQKDDTVERMKYRRESGQSAGELGRDLQRLSDTIKSSVAAEFEPQLARLRELSEEHIATLNNRTWPWFFFQSINAANEFTDGR